MDLSDQSGTPVTDFDVNLVQRHEYLGEAVEFESAENAIVEGNEYTVPLVIPQEDTVLFPGMQLPLNVAVHIGRYSVRAALLTEGPLSGIFVFSWQYPATNQVAQSSCLAVVRRVRQSDQRFLMSVVVEGLCRVRIQSAFVAHSNVVGRLVQQAVVRILPKESVPRIRSEIYDSLGTTLSPIFQRFDPYALADQAFDEASKILPMVKDMRNDPLSFSYWLATALPISYDIQTKLFAEDCVSLRLQSEIAFLSKMSGIYCSNCRSHIGEVNDFIAMSTSGPSDRFVNAHGVIHDLLTLSCVSNATLYGQPTTEYSWFPGYAWTIAICSQCSTHIGWRFTAVSHTLLPNCFWGLARKQITHRILNKVSADS